MNLRGVEYGLVAKEEHPDVEFPLTGKLAIFFTVWTDEDEIDGDNMIIGFKPFVDGLQTIQADQSAGAGVIDERPSDQTLVHNS